MSDLYIFVAGGIVTLVAAIGCGMLFYAAYEDGRAQEASKRRAAQIAETLEEADGS